MIQDRKLKIVKERNRPFESEIGSVELEGVGGMGQEIRVQFKTEIKGNAEDFRDDLEDLIDKYMEGG